MSWNSSESKTSPHSRHSTNSASSCRETTRTLGCLQTVAIVFRFDWSRGTFPLLDSESMTYWLSRVFSTGTYLHNPGACWGQAATSQEPEKRNLIRENKSQLRSGTVLWPGTPGC